MPPDSERSQVALAWWPGKGVAEKVRRKPDLALGLSLVKWLIISGMPATKGSRWRPTVGSSKTQVPEYQ